MKYIKLLKAKKDGTDTNNYKLLAKEALLNLQSSSLDVEKDICSLELSLENAKSSSEFSPRKCFEFHNKIELKKRELVYYESLEKELFTK